MKFKFSMKLLALLCALVCLMFTILSIRDTYARYITSLTAKSYVEMGSWLITVNDQNILENSNFTAVLTPILNENTEYIADDKIAPTTSGYFQFEIDFTDVKVPFTYEISFEPDDTEFLEDFKFTTYSLNGTLYSFSGSSLTRNIVPSVTPRTHTYIMNFAWVDTAASGATLTDVEDTKYSHDLDNIKFDLNISFTQTL